MRMLFVRRIKAGMEFQILFGCTSCGIEFFWTLNNITWNNILQLNKKYVKTIKITRALPQPHPATAHTTTDVGRRLLPPRPPHPATAATATAAGDCSHDHGRRSATHPVTAAIATDAGDCSHDHPIQLQQTLPWPPAVPLPPPPI